MIAHLDIEYENRCPTGLNSWEIRTTKLKVEYPVHSFYKGEVFGHQEIVESIR